MIATLTLNPAIDYVQFLPKLGVGEVNRSSSERLFPGGKGINVSYVIKTLGGDTCAFGFVAGETGRMLDEMLKRQGILTSFVQTNGITRINVKLMAEEETEINGSGGVVSEENIEELFFKLEQLPAGSILAMGGSVPRSMPQDIYSQIIRRLKQKDIRVALDTSGKALREAIKEEPYLIKPNHLELSELLGTKIETPEEVVRAAKELQAKGVKNILCSMGADGAVFVGEDGTAIYGKAPKGTVINTVGAGDSLLAGFLFSYRGGANPKEALKLGLACGSATAFSEYLASKELVEELMKQPVEITTI
ncbi:MAG: 1-phosphofructokinase [Clostridia bacterium]|nr:1-phosphofructokinase [Clostridia bacterium]